jgi:hypothetical protein
VSCDATLLVENALELLIFQCQESLCQES